MSNRLKELRLSRKMTLKEFANAFNKFTENNRDKIKSVSYATISRWEKGENKPKLETWQALADYFDVSMLYLQGLSDTKKWTPEKGREAVKKASIKEFNSKYCHDEKILQNISDDMKPIINNFDDDISVLKAILLSSNNKNNKVISMNIDLMFLLSDVINGISQNLINAYYPSENNEDSKVDNEKMLLLSMGYTAILKDTVKKINDFNLGNEKEKMISILKSLDININDSKK